MRTLVDNLVIRYSEAEREVVLAWGKPRGGHRFDQTANEEVRMVVIDTYIPNRMFFIDINCNQSM